MGSPLELWRYSDDPQNKLNKEKAIKAAERLKEKYPESDVFDRAIAELNKEEAI